MKFFRLFFLILISFYFSCNSASVVEEASYTLHLPEGFPEPDYPKDNALTAARVALGKRLFYDPLLSRDSSISCNSCHKQAHAFSDPLAISPGVAGRLGKRNAMSLVNLAYTTKANRDGGVPKLDLQAIVPIETEEEMDFTAEEISQRLLQDPSYVQLFQEAYERGPDAFTITRALGAFQRTLLSGNSAYDQYEFQGKKEALNASEIRGKELFFSARLNCSSCHNGFNFTTGEFANNGLYEVYEDNGRRDVTLAEEDIGRFKIPTLRNIAVSAPYMHNGSLNTLEEVIDHYNQGGKNHPNKDERIKPLNLTEAEKTDLINFLESLTDSTFLNNPAFFAD
jgi:cytochrome c peroxidase